VAFIAREIFVSCSLITPYNVGAGGRSAMLTLHPRTTVTLRSSHDIILRP